MRPLNSIPSLKVKFGIVIVAAVGITAFMSSLGAWLGWPGWLRPIIAAGLALLMVQFLAKGTTWPLRQMATAAQKMTGGDYSQRIEVASVDEVGRLAGSFNLMVAELEQVERQRRELVANVSHELRTPIAAIQVNLENLVDGVTEWDEARGRVMLDQVERLGRLVTQLLDLARLESGAAPLSLQPFAVRPLIESVVAETELHGHAVDLRVTVDPSIAMTGDAERLHQLLANLVDNAVRHSPEGAAVTIVAETAKADATTAEIGSPVVRFTVSDEGPGIPETERERIFERFHRADADRSTGSGGSGLGLSIARWIVDLHHGSIRATENKPQGARMVVELPATPP